MKYERYKSLLDLGKITSSNNFLKNKSKNIRLKLGYNPIDGSIKLLKKNAYRHIKASHFIKNNEPEFHLKDVCKNIKSIAKKQKLTFKKIFGLSYKDKPLVNLITKKTKIKKFSLNHFFKKLEKKINTEKLLFHFENLKLSNIKKKEKFDILILRHIWEHVFDQRSFLKKISHATHNQTLFYFEVPDSEKMIKKFDYSMIWEEHMYYYSKISLMNSLHNHNFKILKFLRYKQKYEDILCVVATKNHNLNKEKIKKDKRLVRLSINYGKKFFFLKRYYKKKFKEISLKGNLFAYGASHMLNVFINIFNLENFLSLIIDDNKIKQNNYMFYNNLKIYSFQHLKKNYIKNCLLAVNPESSSKLKKKITYLKKKKIKIFSIFQ